jgi:serine/threonine protein kinase
MAENWPAIPGYEILGELGRGGMGVVYRALQVSSQRMVALKLIRDSALAGPRERARFRIEAEAAARMHHPHLVQIYEVSEHQGQPYFAMELVQGGSLDRRLQGQPQSASVAAQLVRALALAIQHAHAHHIVHRDLKPANILLEGPPLHSADGVSTVQLAPLHAYQPKITDFGLAKRLDSESTAWTQDGAVLGTAGYMAPEQAAGRVREIGPAVDVHALGAILYELLTGRPPFQGDSQNETLQQVIHEDAVAPSRLQSDVPRDLETICLQCLEKAPDRRYASAQELADDLRRFLQGQSIAAVPVDRKERLARLAARHGYQIVAEIGRGPRSTVYRVLHDPLKQPLALKVFDEGCWTQEEWEARLQRGAEMWVTLTHPHVVRVQGSGWWDGAAYLAVEYVPQGSLASKLGGRRFPLVQALGLVEQLAEIVSYMHRQGVVHGNLKPSNVLLAADDIPCVVDFQWTGGLFGGPLPTDDAEVAGLGYLPPEWLRDPGAESRPYTDIYGLGVILYELLTGRPPFAGDSGREILEQVRSQEPVPPTRFNAKVTPHLETLCLRCLHKDPWRRYYRAHDVFTGLQQMRTAMGSMTASRKRRSQGPPRS